MNRSGATEDKESSILRAAQTLPIVKRGPAWSNMDIRTSHKLA